jgi:tetratricopeptide (TPR) repeat protein
MSKASPWILDRWRDLLLFVGTPVVLIPIFAAAQVRWSAQDIFLFVGAFGAMGHHLPGMIRAYGDPALFQRFKVRFVVAPLALLAVCIWSSVYNIQAVQLVALTWGIWHGMMQTYGFCRIYDAKAGAKAATRARADFALCFAWFVAAVLLSPLRFRSCLDLYYDSGGPLLPLGVVSAIRQGIIGVLALVTTFFFWQQWSDARRGRGLSVIKMLLLASSIAFWWYCNNGVQNILVGIALFEVFHDVQYLSIVWIYNRARVERDQSIRGFMRFVFRRSGSLIGVYVGLVAAYGAIALTTSGVNADWIRNSLIGVVTASALLHFYYDGFIWKVRETQTRSMLGIRESGCPVIKQRRRLPMWALHSLRWSALIIPFTALCAAQLGGRLVPELERTGKVVELLPRDAKAQLNYGNALNKAGRVEEAIDRYKTAIGLDPKLAEAQFDYGKALHKAGRVEEATERYKAAIALDPKLAEAEMFLGLAASDSGNMEQAIAHYERSLSLNPKNATAECNLAIVLALQGRREEARRRFEHSLAMQPNLFLAHKEYGDLLVTNGEIDAAIAHYSEALRIHPDFPEAQRNLDYARSLGGSH